MTTEYRRGDRHVYRHVAGEHLLIALHRHSVAPMFALTPTAAAIWEWLDGWTTPDSLAARLCERFEVDRAQAEQDVAEFLGQLRELEAIELREEMT